jgi:serine/threonine protein phosphatase PrpC
MQLPGKPYRIVISVMTDIGCRRDVNEDATRSVVPCDGHVLREKGVLLVVADGMGGHAGGATASRVAVDVVHRAYYEDDSQGVREALADALRKANRVIYEMAAGDPDLQGMGTTCTALVLRQGQAECAHVGDSRLYLVRDGEIYQMTEDHSMVRSLVARGAMTTDQARRHLDRNIILRALGRRPHVEIALWQSPLPFHAGDAFLLCSDGLHELVREDELKLAVATERPPNATARLITLARSRGGYDNITVAVAAIVAEAKGRGAGTRPTRQVQVAG